MGVEREEGGAGGGAELKRLGGNPGLGFWVGVEFLFLVYVFFFYAAVLVCTFFLD